MTNTLISKTSVYWLYVLSVALYTAMWSSCAAPYRAIRPEELPLEQEQSLADGAVELNIAWRDSILKNTHNNTYARMERRRHVRMMVFRVRNTGQITVSVPECLVFHDNHGITVRALSLDDATVALVYPLMKDSDGDDEVEGCFLWHLGVALCSVQKAMNHLKFIDDLMEYYLEGYLLYPGDEITGFLVVPGVPGSLERVELDHTQW